MAIQFLRGTATSGTSLAAGQPYYNTTLNTLTIGGGSSDTISKSCIRASGLHYAAGSVTFDYAGTTGYYAQIINLTGSYLAVSITAFVDTVYTSTTKITTGTASSGYFLYDNLSHGGPASGSVGSAPYVACSWYASTYAYLRMYVAQTTTSVYYVDYGISNLTATLVCAYKISNI